MNVPRHLAGLILALAFGLTASAQSAPGPTNPGWTNVLELTEKQRKVLSGLARERYGGRWTELTAGQLSQMRRRADAQVEAQRQFHLPGGLVASVRFADTNRSRVVAYEALDISAAQTGYLLAAHAYRFAVMRDPKDLADIRTLLDGVEMLLRSSGRPGYIPRFAGRADDPAYQAFYATYGGTDPARPGLGRLAFPGKTTNGVDLVWLGGSSRDQYAGLNFGLAIVHKLISDPGIRARIAQSASVILDRLNEDQWRIDDGQGNLTFVTPVLKTALLLTGASVDSTRWLQEYRSNAVIVLSQPPRSVTRFGDYAPNVAAFANLLALCRLETDPGRRLRYQEHISQMWRTAESQLNPMFAAAYVGAFDRSPNSSGALSTLEGMLFLFPAPPRWSVGATNSQNPAVTRLTANGAVWSQHALLLDQQPVAPFQWMQSPFRLDGPAQPLVAHAGVDYLVAFWMGRDASVIRSEDAPPPVVAGRRRGTALGTNSPVLTNLPTAPILAPRLTP